MRFAPEYIASVLNDNFEDAKRLFAGPLMAIHSAHLVMLADRAIIGPADSRRLREALDAIDPATLGAAAYDGTFEDLFFYVERLLVQACGEDVAGRLHTARSRNDIDMTMYRMRLREALLDLHDASLALRDSLLRLAAAHRETLMAAHTHTQPAQPTTLAHYLLAVVEQLERDAVRLQAAWSSVNRSPLGACAITGTGFPIDRQLTSDLLGFDAPTGNTYGSIATVDYLVESAAAAAVLLVGLGRFVQDLLLWGTQEFGYLRFGQGFVQCSSIMPQKRNPVAIEHARALGSKALGQAQAIAIAVHNTPFGDVVDTEDDLQPLVASALRDAVRAVTLVAAAMGAAEFDRERLAARAAEGGTTLTELADTLARDHDLPFVTAHAIAGRVLKARLDNPEGSPSGMLAGAAIHTIGRPLLYSDEDLRRILSPRHFVEVRQTLGGPAPAETERAIAVSVALLDAHAGWSSTRRTALRQAEARLRERAAAL